ncbi:large ribosomal subunit protein bL20m [Phymastichus coffea]|uniref:large ribosomal subunit protein bL20m n=1 Tax=Phymastichus coffea TaxID=108790 RepID=UPI00273B6170|nr:large ribosomal subunit protein bL20m [Phymastichus coffea]
MVLQSLVRYARSRGPDEFWRKRRIFKLSAHFKGRFRNCYSMAIRAVHRSLQFATKGRQAQRSYQRMVSHERVDAACIEHGMNLKALKEGLLRCNILLNSKSLAELAVWEPRTFKSIVKIACARVKQDGLNIIKNLQKPTGVINRGEIK